MVNITTININEWFITVAIRRTTISAKTSVKLGLSKKFNQHLIENPIFCQSQNNTNNKLDDKDCSDDDENNIINSE